MTLQHGYWIALGALVVIISVKGCWQMKRSVYALLAVGVVSMILANDSVGVWPFLLPGFDLWPSSTYGLLMMGVDFVAAWIVLWRPAGKIQSLLGITLVFQMGVHAGKLLRGADTNFEYYYWALSVLAIAQLLLVGGWWLHERITWSDRVPDRRPSPVPAHRKGLG